MQNNNENNGFNYTYSAKEQEEIKRIREKYTRKDEDKMEKLRRLDNGVYQKAQALSLIFGVIGALVLGFGMSLVMSELPLIMGLDSEAAMIIGIPVGVIGGALAGFAYPIYNYTVKRERKKIAPEIIRLTDELLK